MTSAVDNSVALAPPKRRRVPVRRRIVPYVLIMPGMLLLAAMMVYPLIQTVVFSFAKVQLPTFRTSFIGLKNFTQIFGSDNLQPMLGRTLFWIVGTVVLRFILGFWAALTFNATVKGTIVLRILCILPWTVPSIASANLWRWLLQSDTGLIDQTLKVLGLPHLALNWLADPRTAMPVVMVAYSWAGFPFIMLLLLAGMQGIPKESYEAAKVDGANWWQLFRHITIPSLRGVIIVAILLEIISALNSFDMLYVLTTGGPGNSSQILSQFIYQTGFTSFNLGGASALSTLLLVVAFGIFLLYAVLNSRSTQREGRS